MPQAVTTPTPAPRSARKPLLPWWRRHPRLLAGAAVLMALALAWPWLVGSIAARLVTGRLAARLGRVVTLGRATAGFGHVVFEHLVVQSGGGQAPPLSVVRIEAPLAAAWGGGSRPVVVEGLEIALHRGGDGDNVTDILARLGQGRHTEGAGPAAGRRLPPVEVHKGRLRVDDEESGLTLVVADLDGELRPGERAVFHLQGVEGKVKVGRAGPTFGADRLDVEVALSGLRPAALPGLAVHGGSLVPLPTLALTGIVGKVTPGPGADRVTIDLEGSWGGAKETLWNAHGWLAPHARSGALALKAERFTLDRIADALHGAVAHPEQASVDARLDLAADAGNLTFSGELGVAGLTVQHEALATAPVEGLALQMEVRGRYEPGRRRLEIERFEGRLRDLVGRLSGVVELAPGEYAFPDGSKLHSKPRIDLRLQVPRLACARLLSSIPRALVPRLQGFELQGFFEADIAAHVDYADLDALDLKGKVGIDGCKVLTAPAEVTGLVGSDPIVQMVEVPKGPEILLAPVRAGTPAPGQPGGLPATELVRHVVGPENPDFTPFEEISPYLINSIMTTEDSGFFKHRGFVTSEFKTALRRNLEKGGFRLGASSITMQMVKNLVLSREKTLSRKLQELFLVWYLEQEMPKERILELYFNGIEFGPRIWGIGAATRHYFGKRPGDLTPLEAAFFSSILPNPKKRYIQYCHGSLLPPWEKYVRRIMAKVHERGRLTDGEYGAAAASTLVFDRNEAIVPEKLCLDWVKKITEKPEADTPAEPDAPP